MPKTKAASADPILAELVTIKKLIVLSLLRTGANQKQVASALGLDQAKFAACFLLELLFPAAR
jgi:hypothetical protein